MSELLSQMCSVSPKGLYVVEFTMEMLKRCMIKGDREEFAHVLKYMLDKLCLLVNEHGRCPNFYNKIS